MAELGIAAGVVVQVVYGFRWLTGLESRIGTHEKTCDERMKRLDERHAAILSSLEDIKRAVARGGE